MTKFKPHVGRIVLVVLMAILVFFSWQNSFESMATQQVDKGLQRALTGFASGRLFNAGFSVLKNTEFAVQPLGVGVKIAPLRLLEPINDLAQKFSDLMLLASIAFGIEKILIVIGAHPSVSILLSFAAVVWAGLYLTQYEVPRWLVSLFAILLMVRFAVPVVVIGSEILFQQFMQTEYQANEKMIQNASERLGSISTEISSLEEQARKDIHTEKASEGWGRLVPDAVSSRVEATKHWLERKHEEIRAGLEYLKTEGERLVRVVIMQMVIFTLQTLIIPVVLLWGLWSVIRGLVAVPPVLMRQLVQAPL